MADAKISALLELTSVADDDLLVIVDVDAGPATTKKVQVQNVTRKAAFVGSRLNSNQATGAVNNTFTTLSFGSDYASYLNSFMDRPTATQFRALVAGWYRVSFELWADPGANDRGAEVRIIKNGVLTGLTGSKATIGRAQSGATSPGIACKTFLYQMAVNDYLEVQAAPLDATAVTFQSYSTIAFEFVTKV